MMAAFAGIAMHAKVVEQGGGRFGGGEGRGSVVADAVQRVVGGCQQVGDRRHGKEHGYGKCVVGNLRVCVCGPVAVAATVCWQAAIQCVVEICASG